MLLLRGGTQHFSPVEVLGPYRAPGDSTLVAMPYDVYPSGVTATLHSNWAHVVVPHSRGMRISATAEYLKLLEDRGDTLSRALPWLYLYADAALSDSVKWLTGALPAQAPRLISILLDSAAYRTLIDSAYFRGVADKVQAGQWWVLTDGPGRIRGRYLAQNSNERRRLQGDIVLLWVELGPGRKENRIRLVK